MLTHLDIRDLAVVESLGLAFAPGLTVLTGETGAGKSILLTALGLALGDRADSAFVRPGAARAEINLGFDLADSPGSLRWLEDQELAAGTECLVRRTIAADGRSRAFINGSPVNLQTLQSFGQNLIEIHGQHAHVQLAKPQEQRRLLDAFSGTGQLAADVENLYRRWRQLRDELRRLTSDAAERQARLELLQFQVDELEQLDIAALRYAELVEEQTRQAGVERILDVGQAELEALYEDETLSVYARLAHALHSLADLARLAPELSEIRGLLQEAQLSVKEASLQLRRNLDRLDADPARLATLEQRLADVHRLARKHHLRPDELPAHLLQLRAELDRLTGGSAGTERLAEELAGIERAYRDASCALSRQRTAGAERLQGRISAIIRELGMPQGEFRVQLRSDDRAEPSAGGADSVEFLVSANPGMPLRPLARVASGGELSRIGLAIQVAATDGKRVPTLVFDEVDSGIGGGVAEVVGQKLRLLGLDRQVFCVTHLAQVASQGHRHLLVEKHSDAGGTHSSVRLIEGEARRDEIARMLGGVRITPQTLAHAREMLELAAVDRPEPAA